MFSEDYLMRMIAQAIAVLLKLIGLKKEGRYEDALQSVDLALELLVGLKADLVRRLDDASLYKALSPQGTLDTQRLSLLADVFAEEGEILAAQGRPAEGLESSIRALTYYLEAEFNAEGKTAGANVQKIAALADQIGLEPLPDATLWALFCHAEQIAAYARAEDALSRLAARPSAGDALRPEVRAFYQRMLEKPPAELAEGGLSPAHVREKLAKS